MACILAFTLIYFNVIDRDDAPPTGVGVGDTCPDITLPLVGSDESFSVQDNLGRVTVLNFWYTTCTPCLEELPHYYDVAKEYSDYATIVATHIYWPNLDVKGWIASSSGHPEWNDGTMLIAYDEGKKCQNLFGMEAFPVTIVIDTEGVISDYFTGALTRDELVEAIEKALG